MVHHGILRASRTISAVWTIIRKPSSAPSIQVKRGIVSEERRPDTSHSGLMEHQISSVYRDKSANQVYKGDRAL